MREFRLARELGLPISTHVSGAAGAGLVGAMARDALLGRDLQIVHGTGVLPQEMEQMARAGTSVSLSPYTELRAGYNITETSAFLAAGVLTGFSIDTTALTGNADMFSVMKLIQNIENGRHLSEFHMSPRRLLEIATIEGARALGIAAHTGSLTPGKHADLIVVNLNAINLGLFTDPAHLLVEAAQPANVDTVIVDGRILKRGGRLVGLEVDALLADAAAALADLRERGDW
jgi:cytosine/adenosine deaminase-related metal-dependent hydrolase